MSNEPRSVPVQNDTNAYLQKLVFRFIGLINDAVYSLHVQHRTEDYRKIMNGEL